MPGPTEPVYALCKHGPGCQYLRHGRCGFAHSIDAVSLPRRLEPQLWADTSHERIGEDPHAGHSGIDRYYGQGLTPKQLERILLYSAQPGTTVPLWARMVQWFYGVCTLSSFTFVDFEWSRRMEEIRHHKAQPREANNYGFVWGKDPNGIRFPQRLQDRISSAQQLPVFEARADWADDGRYAPRTAMLWGKHRRSYLAIRAGQRYVRIVKSDDPVWWYMTQVGAGDHMEVGGWAPPEYFKIVAGPLCTAYELELPTHARQAEAYVADPRPAMPACTTVSFHSDGSCDQNYGFAAAWLSVGMARGAYAAAHVSLAGSFVGAGVSELIGIAGALDAVYGEFLHERAVHFYVDSENALNHVFNGQDPTTLEGRYLWPVIKLARHVLRAVRARVEVSAFHVPTERNLAHHIAIRELRRRRVQEWRRPDVWDDLPAEFATACKYVAYNQLCGQVYYRDHPDLADKYGTA